MEVPQLTLLFEATAAAAQGRSPRPSLQANLGLLPLRQRPCRGTVPDTPPCSAFTQAPAALSRAAEPPRVLPRCRPAGLSRSPQPPASPGSRCSRRGSARQNASRPRALSAAPRSLPAKRPPLRATLPRAHPFPGTSSPPRLSRSAGERPCRPTAGGRHPRLAGPASGRAPPAGRWPRELPGAGEAPRSCPGPHRLPKLRGLPAGQTLLR